MILRGEKTAWLVILGCLIAIAALYVTNSYRKPFSTSTESMSSLSAEASDIKSAGRITQVKPQLTRAAIGKDSVQSAPTDSMRAQNTVMGNKLSAKNRAVQTRTDGTEINPATSTPEERDQILNQKLAQVPKVIAAFNPINIVFHNRILELNQQILNEQNAFRSPAAAQAATEAALRDHLIPVPELYVTVIRDEQSRTQGEIYPSEIEALVIQSLISQGVNNPMTVFTAQVEGFDSHKIDLYKKQFNSEYIFYLGPNGQLSQLDSP